MLTFMHFVYGTLILQRVSDVKQVTYVQVLEQGGGRAEPHRRGGTPTLTDTMIAFCSGMMEEISIRSCI